MKSKVENSKLQSKITTAKEAAAFIKDDMLVAMGGYTSNGYPKVIAKELAKRKQAGEDFQISVLTGGTVAPLDTILAEAEVIKFKAPMLASRAISKSVNEGKVSYAEQQMSHMPKLLKTDAFGKIDVAVIEAIRITEEGFVVPTASVGMIQRFVNLAEHIIIEINVAQPDELEGLHDVYNVGVYPNRKPIPLTYTNERIGEPYIKVDMDKVKYIVKSDILDEVPASPAEDEVVKRLAGNLFSFLEEELINSGEQSLPPIQTGFGKLTKAIVKAFDDSNLSDLEFFCGTIQEEHMELIVNGKIKAVSTGSIPMSKNAIKMLKENYQLFKDKVVIRNTDITNNSEVINRLGIISLVGGIEVDIYGNVNLSHVSGSKVVNGVGGGANFAHNAGLTIALFPSEAKGGDISTIVPMVTHQDISEHDVDVVITEHGIADLRGKTDIEKARAIIENCSSSYKEQLQNYFDRALHKVGGHHPQILSEVFDWHLRLKETGSMRF